ncbi:glycosyltransferase family 2 protein [Microbacterium rhizomatis]|uniref:Glycosyltransferase n=1 Tax=Microbacterium rhizomatis TaxID=1631477 RepID=A0A5J5J2E7_9MICO|nr:glycosyltransferase [Microbacterium rhizomatis]KAA9106478.1 glycosyltransferase [Microbacterium rhizomatis]
MKLQKPAPLRRRPLVTVVVPHYNYGQFLPVSVRSALDQRGVDVEVIIVDDKSTDGSEQVARRLAEEHPQVTLVEHEQNMRHIRTYNDGLSRANGDYVVLLSADDALTTDSLTRSLALLEAHPEVGLVYGRVEWFDGEPPEFGPTREWWQIWRGDEWVDRVCHRGRNPIGNPEVVMRRSVYDDIGGYDPDFPHAGDMFMWLQAAARADVGFIGGPRQAYYRNHGGNMHTNDFGGVLDDMTQVRDVYRRFFVHDGFDLPGAGRMLHTAMKSVARESLLRAALLTAQGAPAETLAQLQRFAEETAPHAADSATWRWADLSRRRVAPAIRATESLRWKVRSRRTDLIGL